MSEFCVTALCIREIESMQKNALLLCQVPESLWSFAFKANMLLAAKKNWNDVCSCTEDLALFRHV